MQTEVYGALHTMNKSLILGQPCNWPKLAYLQR